MINDEETPEFEQDDNKINEEESTEEQSDEESSDTEDDKDWKAEALKYKAILDRNKNKKPEVKIETKKNESSNTLSQRDFYALNQAQVHIDDFDDVVDYAKFKKISVTEALNSDVLKTVLANKSEFRKTSNVSNTSAARKGAVKVSDDALLSNLSKGNIPEKGSEEAERIFWARRGGKR